MRLLSIRQLTTYLIFYHVCTQNSFKVLHRKKMMMMKCFCGMDNRWKALKVISSRNIFHRFLSSQISNTPPVGFEHARNLTSNPVVSSCVRRTHTDTVMSQILSWFRILISSFKLSFSSIFPILGQSQFSNFESIIC